MASISENSILSAVEEILPTEFFSCFVEKTFEMGCRYTVDDRKIRDIVTKINDYNIQYIFVSKKTYYNQSRLARKLLTYKNKNSLQLQISDAPNYSYKNIFSGIYHVNIFELLEVLKRTKLIVFSQSWLYRTHINAFVEIFKGDNAHYVDMMDFNSLMFPEPSNKDIEIMKKTWGSDVFLNNKMQHWCENYILQNANRCYFPGSFKHIDELNLDKELKFKRFFINHPIERQFFTTAPSSKDLVFCGGIPTFDRRRPYEIFGDAQLVTTLSKIYKKDFDFEIHIYNNPLIANVLDYPRLYPALFQLIKEIPKISFTVGYDSPEIQWTIRNYSLALMVYDFNKNIVGRGHFSSIVPTKFYLYLEAGLPIACSDEFISVVDIVEKNEIGFSISQAELYALDTRIKNYDLNSLRGNVLGFRERLFQESLEMLN